MLISFRYNFPVFFGMIQLFFSYVVMLVTVLKIFVDLVVEANIIQDFIKAHPDYKGPLYAAFGQLVEPTSKSNARTIYRISMFLLMYFTHMYRISRWQRINAHMGLLGNSLGFL
jgi:hypothetical protein